MKAEGWIWVPLAILVFEAASVLTTGWPAGLVPNLSYPDVYSGDGLAAAWWIQRLLEGGAFHSDRSGYPFGSDVFDYPMSDAGSFVILRLIGLMARSYWATMNLYYLLGFPVTFVASYVVLRRMQVSRSFSAAGAVLFTLLPFHFLRFLELKHVFLTWYFVVPIFFLFAWQLYSADEAKDGIRWRTIALHGAGLVVLASFGAYYALFGVIVLIVAGCAGYLRARSTARIGVTFAAVGFVAIGVVINVLPTLSYTEKDGVNEEVAH